MDFLSEMKWRGLIHQCSDEEGLADRLRSSTITAYIGFDPTAPSLHVGSLIPVLTLRRFQEAGHRPIAIVGGGTGLIGDPSGKTSERQLLTREESAVNMKAIRRQLELFLDFSEAATQPIVLDNSEWLDGISMIDFFRDIGKHFSVNEMIRRDSVRRRLESREQGISFTEFAYSLLQAYDFLVLYEGYKCVLQMGGSDQWGNSIQGVELIRRVHGETAYVLTSPLITAASGQKFGKTESGTIWLDPLRTSPYQFYQFWLNAVDSEVIAYLKYFTSLTEPDVTELEKSLRSEPEKREAQKTLAQHVTQAVHGSAALLRAQRATDVLFGRGDLSQLSEQELLEAFQAVPSVQMDMPKLLDGLTLADVLVATGIEASNAQARRDISQGALAVNGRMLSPGDDRTRVDPSWLLHGRYIVLRRGKKDYSLAKFV
jgi:tyrosyl-tRNA synthetase